jgi:hypothetical protein
MSVKALCAIRAAAFSLLLGGGAFGAQLLRSYDGRVEPGDILCDRVFIGTAIYALTDPREPRRIRYVGRAVNPVARYRAHCSGGGSAVSCWAASLLQCGVHPIMLLVEQVRDVHAEAAEERWIRYYRARGQADLNRTKPRHLA